MNINMIIVSKYGDTIDSTSRIIQILDSLNIILVARLKEITEVYSYISDSTIKIDYIVFDAEDLFEMDHISMWEIVSTLSTLIKSTSFIDENTNQTRNTKIIAAIKQDTSLELIKNLISHTDINGIVYRSDDYSYEESYESIQNLILGKNNIPKDLKEKLSCTKKKTVSSDDSIKLTARQNQILNLISNRGASNKIIARTLNITESTVKLHIGTILKKFGVRNRTQLAILGKNITTEV